MTNPTSNFGWQMPTSTDLVTDLPADFEVFGQAVDTSLADLKGGTTGQILSKTTDANMDFTWITNDVGDITAVTAGTGISGGGTSGAVTVTNSMATAIDAKGDLIGGTGADTFARLAVGANNTILTADSAEATGMKWAAPASSIPANSTATVATNQSTSSATYTDLTTAGPAVTLTTGTKALVIITSRANAGGAETAYMSYAVSGATTIAASDEQAAITRTPVTSTDRYRYSLASIPTLTAGSNTFTAKYRSSAGNSAFQDRNIFVMNLA
jgi:hypothetical protein